jgi:hypothetical protein
MDYITYEIKTTHSFRKIHHLQSSSSSSSSLSTSNFSTSKEEMEKNRMSVSCLCREPTVIATEVYCQLNNCADEPQVMAPGNGPGVRSYCRRCCRSGPQLDEETRMRSQALGTRPNVFLTSRYTLKFAHSHTLERTFC